MFQFFLISLVIIIFSGVLLLAELYILPIYKYFTFVLTTWGKSFLYFVIGSFFLGFSTLFSFICWGLGVFFAIITFTGQGIAIPLLQTADSVDLTQNTKDFFA